MSEVHIQEAFTTLLCADTRQSLCPVCLKRIAARHEADGDTIMLVKRCPQHGEFRTPVWRGEPAMQNWKKPKLPTPPAPHGTTRKGCPFDCGLCPEHNQHTCTVLFEVTSRCNLRCRFCFASAGEEAPPPDPALDELQALMDAVRPQTGPCNVQISGGEPTMREDLPDIIRMAKERFPFVQINTNGLHIAQHPQLARQLAEAGLDSAFLQFDGTSDDIYKTLRGAPLLQQKLDAIRLMGEAGIGVVLVPTVVPAVNDHNLGEILKLGAKHSPVVRGVHFQPVSHFGRYPVQAEGNISITRQEGSMQEPPHTARITLPEIMRNLETQTNRLVTTQDFLPPGCEHSMCSFHANYMIRKDGTFQRLSVQRSGCDCKPQPASKGADAAKAFVKRQWAAAPLQQAQGTQAPEKSPPALQQPHNEDTSQPEPLNDLDRFLQRAATHTFAVSAMAFQDVWNIDLERVRGCCIHVAAPDGRLVPFCAWNCTSASGKALHRDSHDRLATP
ncbi:radical SAM (seleno)protein TrsS [Oleidesulfovibrio sp.]|uniref:radical SAM (seleno)protein TrsS n=1 Tax=Oleidesulfovibrio sp. TaxID=2909707 RepID=UPI003A884247